MKRFLNILAAGLLIVLALGRFWALQGSVTAHGSEMDHGTDASTCLVHCLATTPAFGASNAPMIVGLIFAFIALALVSSIRFPAQLVYRPAYAFARAGPDPRLLLSIFKKE